jgi:hypothetical protein
VISKSRKKCGWVDGCPFRKDGGQIERFSLDKEGVAAERLIACRLSNQEVWWRKEKMVFFEVRYQMSVSFLFSLLGVVYCEKELRSLNSACKIVIGFP